ncbi:uncharacterized protein LOC128204746 [Mya arenaria]|uniref:uncharacterized protein LOC128204746 n=1 Tax=Mya arenaria TaxID=6604 RepID=UPI0022DFE464|nr:uncharacterized protein LOC128204746 [Mya arenaria]
MVRDYVTFLEQSRSYEGQRLISEYNEIDSQYNRHVEKVLKDIEHAKTMLEAEVKSVRSNRSNTSNASKAMIKAEGAKRRVAYAEKELLLRKKEAALREQEAMAAAKIEREMSEIQAELNTLKEQRACEEEETETNLGSISVHEIAEVRPEERTRIYVESVAGSVSHRESDEQIPSLATELSKFLIKKDLLFNRLYTFNDAADKYVMWKEGFSNVVSELNVTCVEELDLLVKWLGPQSKKHAISIKTAYISDPQQALVKVWKRLDERYGAPEVIEMTLNRKLSEFPRITTKDQHKLYDLSDLLAEIQATKQSPTYSSVLAYFDSSTGVNPIVQKLPYHIQSKWTHRAIKYMKRNDVVYPPFSEFAMFVCDMSSMLNNPSFVYEQNTQKDNIGKKVKNSRDSVNEGQRIRSYKTEVAVAPTDMNTCSYHNVVGHNLNGCRSFINKPFGVRKKYFRDNKLCFNCGLSTNHRANSCQERVICTVCNLNSHPTALHAHGGEARSADSGSGDIRSACTKICGRNISMGKSCAKVVLVTVHSINNPVKKKKMYALIDDQSNRSLARPEFFNLFEEGYTEVPYRLSSCAGVTNTTGRRADSDMFVISSFDGSSSLNLPSLTECNQIPDMRDEIPTPDSALYHSHLEDISAHIPEVDPSAEILLLLGRDLPEAHHVLEQRTGPRGSPYAQKLSLGWVVIGETCLGKVHQPTITVKKTFVHVDGRSSVFPECQNKLIVKDVGRHLNDNLDSDEESQVFLVTDRDEKIGTSIEDKEFLGIMDSGFKKNSKGSWTAPLPFKSSRPRLPNNRNMVLNRMNRLVDNLRKNETKQRHFMQFMQGMIDNGHAEVAAPVMSDTECWYLPIFGIYHPKKVDQIRVVFDSSATYMGLSLNRVLMTGPDLHNSLLGVLMRFRREPVAVSADIQQMFYQFQVEEKDRNYLRFFWFKDNNPELPLVEYRMCVHVFGNSPSPAIATYGLHKSVLMVEDTYGSDVANFVLQDFYVDDGLVSLQTPQEAIDLMKRTQQALDTGGKLKLHKISSNSREVMKAFPKEDLAKDLKDLDLGHENLPVQRSLGMNWNLDSDYFTFTISEEIKPCTRRGILSTLNSLFDPLGFISPVVVHGRIIMRDLMSKSPDWDEPLPVDTRDQWVKWCESLKHLEDLKVPRTYLEGSLSATVDQQIHIFSDASEKAIAAVAYLKTIDANGDTSVGFIIGKSKVSPKHGHTIPRLELCAAVLAVELADIICEHLHMPVGQMRFYTDSRVVLGYLHNRVRRFYVYVENRVSRILKLSRPDQWCFVPTKENPADLGTRPTPAETLQDSIWLCGPSFLLTETRDTEDMYQLHSPADDPEIRPVIQCIKTNIVSKTYLNTRGFETFSQWSRLVNALVVLKRFVRRVYRKLHGASDSIDNEHVENHELKTFAEKIVIQSVQREVYFKEIDSIQNNSRIPKDSSIVSLNPVIDEEGTLRFGGRLRNSDLEVVEKYPIILPGKHHTSRLVVQHYHERVKHQGRHFTEGAIREEGFWITGAKRLVMSVIHHCVKCQRLRGGLGCQKMADLPTDRLRPGPPFTSVGLDCFGPWHVVSRRTRGGQAANKRWAVLFTCLTSRAVHIEVIEELSSSSFINALRRFTSIRGKVKVYRSDNGTNFMGALDVLGVNVNDSVRRYMDQEGAVWILNPPHSSHRGGVWERIIGVTRRILDSMLLDLPGNSLTHEVLTTFLAEVSAIINSRPLVPVCADSSCPTPLNPALILTQKSECIVDVVITTDIKDMYRAQWKRVQILAEQFWKRWRSEFLQTLQVRRKWTAEQRDLQCGDVVLLRDKQEHRNYWPMGLVVRAEPSNDGLVRTAEVRTVGKNGKPTTYVRPVNEMVLLVQS